MITHKLLLSLLLILLLGVSIYAYITLCQPFALKGKVWTIMCPAEGHEEYGFTYPVTYVFSFPSEASNLLVAYKRFSLSEGWQRIPEHVESELFNGIEAARFDYINKRAYVSVAFSDYTDVIYIEIVEDKSNTTLTLTYIGTSKYYDNRKTAVTFTVDDVVIYEPPPYGNYQSFLEASRVFSDAHVWWTAGLITGWPSIKKTWNLCQTGVDMGYLEIASHSYGHPDNASSSPPYYGSGYEVEIGLSKQEIIGNLTLPYSKASEGYVWCWIQPSGYSNAIVAETLGGHHYLVSRRTKDSDEPSPWAAWNETTHIYDNAQPGQLLDGLSLDDLKGAFDFVRTTGGIYNVWAHIDKVGWQPGQKGYELIQYVKGKTDVWYVGFGLMYLYHYTQAVVSVSSIND